MDKTNQVLHQISVWMCLLFSADRKLSSKDYKARISRWHDQVTNTLKDMELQLHNPGAMEALPQHLQDALLDIYVDMADYLAGKLSSDDVDERLTENLFRLRTGYKSRTSAARMTAGISAVATVATAVSAVTKELANFDRLVKTLNELIDMSDAFVSIEIPKTSGWIVKDKQVVWDAFKGMISRQIVEAKDNIDVINTFLANASRPVKELLKTLRSTPDNAIDFPLNQVMSAVYPTQAVSDPFVEVDAHIHYCDIDKDNSWFFRERICKQYEAHMNSVMTQMTDIRNKAMELQSFIRSDSEEDWTLYILGGVILFGLIITGFAYFWTNRKRLQRQARRKQLLDETQRQLKSE